ncbi:hypothetical protein EV180_006464, partial [Coemansia sp. RSA 518]
AGKSEAAPAQARPKTACEWQAPFKSANSPAPLLRRSLAAAAIDPSRQQMLSMGSAETKGTMAESSSRSTCHDAPHAPRGRLRGWRRAFIHTASSPRSCAL